MFKQRVNKIYLLTSMTKLRFTLAQWWCRASQSSRMRVTTTGESRDSRRGFRVDLEPQLYLVDLEGEG